MPDTTDPLPDPEAPARERLDEQAKEYGEFVAVNVITIDGARAFNPGDPVPKSHVANGVVSKDDVARRYTKAAKAATGQEG
jgi:hypothetical protein